MDNLNKLLKYLVNPNDIEQLANQSGVDASTIEKICVDIFTKLIPSDFTRSEGAHIEKKDLTAITNNFNNLLNNQSLKAIIGDIVSKYDIDASKASALVKQILVIIRGKLQFMSAAKKPAKPVDQRPRELVKEQELKQAVKQEPIKEEVKETIKEVRPQTRSERLHPSENPTPAKVIKEEVVEEDEDNDELSKGEKIALYIVGGLLVVVIIVIVIVLIKINV